MLDAQKPVRVFSLCYQAWMFEIHLHMDKFYDVFLCAFKLKYVDLPRLSMD